MLARLEVLKDHAAVEVDRSGTFVRVQPIAMAARVQQILADAGTPTVLLDQEAADAALASVKAWFSRRNIRELSREEFHILAGRWASEIEQAAKLSNDQEQRLLASLERAIDDAVQLVPPNQGIPGDPTVWRAARSKAASEVVADAESYLDPTQVIQVKELLEEKLSK